MAHVRPRMIVGVLDCTGIILKYNMSNYIENKQFAGEDFSIKPLATAEYDSCRFINCNFSQSDLSNITFIECEFNGCDFSMAKLLNTTFSDVQFMNCKMLGLHFEDCNKFVIMMSFQECQLNLSSFVQVKLKSTGFINCSLQEVDFAEAVLSGSKFDNCDLQGAIFENTKLEKCDFRGSINYSIDPEYNKLKKARFVFSNNNSRI